MPLILPGNVASALPTGYDVANSCRFNDGDSANFTKTQSGGNQDTWTFSAWIKRSTFRFGTSGNARQAIFSTQHPSSTSENCNLSFEASDELFLTVNDGSGIVGRLGTDRRFSDCGAWYHIVAVWDSADGTAGNRMRMYINGVEETSFKTDTNPDQNSDSYINEANNVLRIGIGGDGGTTSYAFDGYMAEVCLIDGTEYAASDFGEFDEDSPTIWKPKDVSGLTFGTNGFYLDFEASGNLGNDANGGTDFAENNIVAADQATDSPTNNFCTLNPLDNFYSGGTLSEGNCKFVTASSPYGFIQSTFNVSSGKWFWEVKNIDGTATMIGASGATGSASDSNTHGAGFPTASCAYFIDGRKVIGNVLTSYGDAYTDDDIIGVALNLDDDEITFYVNGTVQNSGTAISIVAAASAPNRGYSPAISEESNDSTQTLECNFGGCSAFAVSSANADADGYGAFEYAVPSGYFALCTKNLAEYG